MDMAKISVSGQVTIPAGIRQRLGLKDGDSVVFVEKGDYIVLQNSNRLAFEEFQREMTGEAEKAGVRSEQDAVDLVNLIRQKMWEERC
jgi:AbrB family looped-hinge helix DNA binding protein